MKPVVRQIRNKTPFCETCSGVVVRFRLIVYIFLFSLLVTAYSRAAEPENTRFKVGKTWVTGNKVTDPWVINRECDFESGDFLTSEALTLVVNRLEATSLFNRVEAIRHYQPESGLTDIEFRITESIYLIPYPVLSFNGGRFRDVNYGAGVVNRNFRGMGELIALSGWWGYAPGFSLYYENPWIGGKNSRHYFSADISRINIANRSIYYNNFTEEHLSFNFFVKKYLTRFFYIGVGNDLRRINLVSDLDVNPAGEKKFWFTAPFAEFCLDSRDYQKYAHSGLFLKYLVVKNGVGSKNIDNVSFNLDNRVYYKFTERTALTARSVHQIYSSEPEVFQKSHFGYEYRLRGYFYQIFESNNISLNSLEFRFPISDIRFFSFKNVDAIFGDAGKNLKYGLSGTVFINNGISWNNLSELAIKKSRSGFGVGLNLILPGIEALRLESAWDDHGRYEGILDVGVSF